MVFVCPIEIRRTPRFSGGEKADALQPVKAFFSFVGRESSRLFVTFLNFNSRIRGS